MSVKIIYNIYWLFHNNIFLNLSYSTKMFWRIDWIKWIHFSSFFSIKLKWFNLSGMWISYYFFRVIKFVYHPRTSVIVICGMIEVFFFTYWSSTFLLKYIGFFQIITTNTGSTLKFFQCAKRFKIEFIRWFYCILFCSIKFCVTWIETITKNCSL